MMGRTKKIKGIVGIEAKLKEISEVLEKKVEKKGEIPRKISISEIRKLCIRTKGGKYVRFDPNKSQLKILRITNRELRAGKPVREILLKCRKFGGSTLYAAICYLLMRDYNYKMTIVGQNIPAARNLYKMIKLFYKKDVTNQAIPEQLNTREMIFPDGGEAAVVSAETEDAARSQTNQIVFATEIPSWPNADAQMLSLLNTVSDDPGTFIIVESTPKGVGDCFHRMWLDADHGDNEFIPIFVGWQECEEYERAFKDEKTKDEFMATLDAEEDMLSEDGVKPEKLHWRRWQIANYCGGDVDNFHQEYPSNPAEAFLESGNPVFHQKRLAQWYEEAKEFHPPVFEGEVNYVEKVNWDEITFNEIERTKAFRKQNKGELKVWGWPESHDEYNRVMNYGMGIDVAEGKERKDGQGDESTIFIGKEIWSEDRKILKKIEIVLTWCGRIPPDELGILAVKLGRAYNWANICPEANSMGNSTIKVLWERYKKHRLYRRRGIKHIIGEELRESVGFYSDRASKPTALTQLALFIRENRLVLYDLDTIEELSKIINEKGRIDTNGRDRTVATMLVVEACISDHKNIKPVKEITDFQKYVEWKKAIRHEAAMDRRCAAMLRG